MRRINIVNVPPGAVLARPLVDERGAFVLAAGKALNSGTRERLRERGFRYIYVEDIGFEDLQVQEPLEPQTYMRARIATRTMIEQVREMEPLEVPVEELNGLAGDVCEELERIPPGEGFLLYPEWGSLLDKRLAFAVNVGVIAAIVGRAIEGVSAARHLFVAALLQDLGLWRVERAQEHVAVAKELLRSKKDVSALVKAVVTQHHERLDGSGYPAGKTGEDIHPLARIMSVVVAVLGNVEQRRVAARRGGGADGRRRRGVRCGGGENAHETRARLSRRDGGPVVQRTACGGERRRPGRAESDPVCVCCRADTGVSANTPPPTKSWNKPGPR